MMDFTDQPKPSSEQSNNTDAANVRQWSSLNRFQRRVVGVLVEKSKTTPDVYPMTVNAIRTGANQKSNRKPKMDLENIDVENMLIELRQLGAVVEVLGDGRVPKYKHTLYEWLEVDKKELAVMAELLLRGEQTLGDLRARASRMNPIADQSELKEILHSLITKELVVELTPPGRGQLVTHNLYGDEELEKVRRNIGSVVPPTAGTWDREPEEETGAGSSVAQQLAEMTKRIESLEQQVAQLQKAVNDRSA